MSAHHCHAHGCTVAVPPAMFMCRRHWYALKKPVRDAIWREYRPGQEDDKTPSLRYLAVQRYAVGMSAFRPHDEVAAAVAAQYVMEALHWREASIATGFGDPLAGLLPEEAKAQKGTS